MTYLMIDPRFDSLRGKARFGALLKQVGLPAGLEGRSRAIAP